VHARRDHGGIYFVDLRDRYGITQVVLGRRSRGRCRLSAEDVVSVTGEVVARSAANVNRGRRPGEIEIDRARARDLVQAVTPPIDVTGAT
jgi:aspartyl-tRNA synthetase